MFCWDSHYAIHVLVISCIILLFCAINMCFLFWCDYSRLKILIARLIVIKIFNWIAALSSKLSPDSSAGFLASLIPSSEEFWLIVSLAKFLNEYKVTDKTRQFYSECLYLVMLIGRFCSCDLDLDPTTLMYELALCVLKMNMCAKNKDSSSGPNRTDTYTHRQTDTVKRITVPHLRVVVITRNSSEDEIPEHDIALVPCCI